MQSYKQILSQYMALGLFFVLTTPVIAQHLQVLNQLNDHDTVRGREQIKSYRVIFDAYLTLDPPPMEVGEGFNLTTIHAKMAKWDLVSSWAESNAGMTEAILQCKDRNVFGLPYTEGDADSVYDEAHLTAEIAVGGSLRRNEFQYIKAIDVIAAFATAEQIRFFEAGEVEKALDLGVAHLFLLRQLCDRRFLEEKLHSIQLLVDALSNMRDMFYVYFDRITPEQYTEIAWFDLPFLRPDRRMLLIPEGDKIISEALLDEVFDKKEQADEDLFAATFGGIQSRDAPLERFGAAKRWRMIAPIHSSLQASKDRLILIYDDWWRRWRVQQYDTILESETQFDRTNSVRYAAVIYSMQNIEDVFGVRNQLVAGVSGTIMAAGLSAYNKELGNYPDNQEKLYGQYIRKITDIDPYDLEYGHLSYRRLEGRTALDTPNGRLWLKDGDGLLYALGEDNEDGRAAEHTDTGVEYDLVLWPPIKALSREQGIFID